MANRRTYSSEDRQRALELCEQLGSVAEASRQSGVPRRTLLRWRSQAGDGANMAPHSRCHADGDGHVDGHGAADDAPARDDSGRFKPGHSGNPGGRSSARAAAERLAAERAPQVLDVYSRLFDALASGDETAQRQAAKVLKGSGEPWLLRIGNRLLDHGIGKPPSSKEVREDDAGPGLQFAGRRVDLSKLSDDTLREILAAMEPEEEEGGGGDT